MARGAPGYAWVFSAFFVSIPFGDVTAMINGINDLSLFAPLCNPRRRRGVLHRIYLRGAT